MMIATTITISNGHLDPANNYQFKNVMKAVTSIYFEPYFKMNEEQRQAFLKYKFKSLQSLDLSYQDVDDDFIKEMCKNGGLKWINNIDLSFTKVTYDLLEFLREHKDVCSKADKIGILSNYGKPIVYVYINVDEACIRDDRKDRYFWLTNYEHSIYSYYWKTQMEVIKELKVMS